MMHVLVVGLVAVSTWITGGDDRSTETLVEFEVMEVAPPKPPAPVKTEPKVQEIQTKRRAPAPEPEKPVERVFGLQKDAVTADAGPSNVTVKKGNTLTKEVDDKKLTDDSPLPAPKPEYLVSQMPLLIKSVLSEVPPQAKKQGVFESTVVLNIYIDEKGKVRRATVLNDPGYGMGDIAKKAMMGFLFEPAIIDGQPVPTEIRYEYAFQVQ
jgi:protein TonB